MCCWLWTLCHTIQHRAVLIIFPLHLQTITITRCCLVEERGEPSLTLSSSPPSSSHVILTTLLWLHCNSFPATLVSDYHNCLMAHNHSHTNTGARLLPPEFSAFASKLCSLFFMCILITWYLFFTWSTYSSSSRFRIVRKLSSSGKLNASHWN